MTAPRTSTAAARKLQRRQRIVRVVAIVIGLAFGGFAIAAMSSKNPKQAASGIQQVVPGPSEGGGGSNTSVAPAPPSSAGATNDTSAGGGSGAGSGTDIGSGAGATPTGSETGSQTGTTTGGSSGGSGGGGGSPTPTSARKVAIVTPLLSTSAFATSTGVPVLCGVMASATGPFVSKPQLAAIASAITSSCNQFGDEGTTALQGLNQQLSALAAIDPAVDPLLNQLAAIFQTAGSSQNLPFTANILYLVQLISFFHS